MAINQASLDIRRSKVLIGDKPLGLLGIIGAPALLLQFTAESFNRNSPHLNKQLIAFLGVLYIGGWICGAVGLRRSRASGDGKISKIVFVIQIMLLTLALLFSVFDTLGFTSENGGLLFAICDACYPLSHLFMIIVGILVWRAKILSGFSRFSPLIVGLALPLTFASAAIVGMEAGVIFFGISTAIGLGTMAYFVYSNQK